MKKNVYSIRLLGFVFVGSILALACNGSDDDDDTDASSFQCTMTEQDVKAWQICGVSASEIYGVGEEDVIHFDGNEWESIPGGYTGAYSINLWCSSGSDIFIGGHTGSTPKSLIRHYDGQTWSDMEHPDGYEEIISIWGASPSSVFAIATSSTATNSILYYNGASWSELATDIGTYEKVWGTSATDVYALRKITDDSNRDRMLHYNGEAWSEIVPPVEGLVSIVDVWGTDSSNLYFVGKANGGSTWTGWPVIVRKQGATWTPTLLEFPYDDLLDEAPDCGFTSIWGYGDDSIFAFGCRNQYFDGEQWLDLTDQLYQQGLYGSGTMWGTDLKNNLVIAGYGRMLEMSCEQQ